MAILVLSGACQTGTGMHGPDTRASFPLTAGWPLDAGVLRLRGGARPLRSVLFAAAPRLQLGGAPDRRGGFVLLGPSWHAFFFPLPVPPPDRVRVL